MHTKPAAASTDSQRPCETKETPAGGAKADTAPGGYAGGAKADTAPGGTPAPVCLFTVDLEDWFHSLHLRAALPVASWDRLPGRLRQSVPVLLHLLARHRVRATFFVLGWTAERDPDVVRMIARAGHEIACHGYDHVPPLRRAPDEFRRVLVRARSIIEQAVDRPVHGFRAPAFSLDRERLDVVASLGFRYDSSHHPFGLHDYYGSITGLGEALLPDVHRVSGLWEVGLPVEPFGPARVPVGGGGYLRLLPPALFRALVRRAVRRRGHYVFYMHPWELDGGQPRVGGLRGWARFRHYQSLHRTAGRVDALLRMLRRTHARFMTMGRFVEGLDRRFPAISRPG